MSTHGIKDPEKLRQFFNEKGHPWFVIRLADVLDMLQSDQIFLLTMLLRLEEPLPDSKLSLRDRIQRCGFNGYCRLSIDTICQKLTMLEIEKLQAWTYVYRDVRQQKMEPSKTEPCECLGKNGKCQKCAGTGKLSVLLEVSDLEQQLAQGIEWDKIVGVA